MATKAFTCCCPNRISKSRVDCSRDVCQIWTLFDAFGLPEFAPIYAGCGSGRGTRPPDTQDYDCFLRLVYFTSPLRLNFVSALAYVPTRSADRRLRRYAITDSAVIRPVFGFSDGIFSIDIEKLAESESTSTQWVLRVSAGSAQISSLVRSGATPASESATATLRFAGNPFAASRALPSNIFSGSALFSDSMLVSTLMGAAARP